MRNKGFKLQQIIAYVLVVAITLGYIQFDGLRTDVEAAQNMITLYFVDNTNEKWVKNDNAIMELVDNTNGHVHYDMVKQDDVTWKVQVPKNAFNITFNRFDSGKSTQWNSWSAGGRNGNNAYYADGTEYGHWEYIERYDEENYFHAGDIVYLDLTEFTVWENDKALMYVNFTGASKEENGEKDVNIQSADKALYKPQLTDYELMKHIYIYICSEEEQGSDVLRFWRGSEDTLWNCSIALTYEEYKKGKNSIKVKGWDLNGNIYSKDYEVDTDGDGLYDELEIYLGTDIHEIDTDGDGLTDYQEVMELRTNPLITDTDNNGVSDYYEDNDEDGLVNGYEYIIGTSPIITDTDFDGINDFKEVNVYLTNPLEEDTDGDGGNDGWEVTNNYDPLIYNASFTISYEAAEVCEARPVSASVSLELLSGDVNSLEVNPVSVCDNPYLSPMIAGYLGCAYDFSVDGTFNNAEMTFYYDETVGTISEEFQPRIYYFNEQTKMLEELPEQQVSKGKVTVTVEHFSKYILLNSVEFNKVWEQEIKPPIQEGDDGKTGLDVIFVIDSSGSMSWNDASDLRLKAAKAFVEKLGENDRGAVVDFDSSAVVYQGFTNDHVAINNAINCINSSGGTSLSAGISTAITLYTDSGYQRTDAYKYIIFLTDGDGDYNNIYTQVAADNDIIIYTIGLGNGVNENILKQIAEGTNGKYYFATTAASLDKIYDDISEETIDYVTDSNNDGISDYYTELIKEGKLVVSNGSTEFKYIDFNYDKNGIFSDDYDGDGLKNGEEFSILISNGKTFISLLSNPVLMDSDGDGLDDAEEVKQKSDPLTWSVSNSVINFFTNSDNYYYEYTADLMDDGFLRWFNEYAAIIYGVWDKEELYRDLIIDYYCNYATEDMMNNEEVEEQKRLWIDTLYSWLNNLEGIVQVGSDSYTYVREIYGLVDIAKGIKEMEDLDSSFYQKFSSLILELNKLSEEATEMRFEINGLKYQKHLLELDSVKKVIKSGSEDIMNKVCDGIAYTTYGLDIIDNVVEISKIRVNNKVFAANMEALDRIIIYSDERHIRNAASTIKAELAGNYFELLNVYFADILESGVKEAIRQGAKENVYIFAVVATRDLADLVFGVSKDIEQEYRILCYHEMSSVYTRLMSNVGYTSKNGQYYYVPENELVDFKRYMVNLEQLRILGEIEYYEFQRYDGCFKILGKLTDYESVDKIKINEQLSYIKYWVEQINLILSEKIKYEV